MELAFYYILKYQKTPSEMKHLNISQKTTTQRAHHVESTSIPRGYYVDMSKTKFQWISTSFLRTSSMQFVWSKTSRRFHVLFSM